MAWEDEDTDVCSILVPVDVVGTAGVISSIKSNGTELAEDTNATWSNSTTYNQGDRVYSASTHRVYEALQTNTNKDPTVVANQTTAAGIGTYWFDVGPTNRTAMFDGLITTATAAPSPLVITLTPGTFNAFALFGIDADSYSVTVKTAPGGTVIYSEPTTSLSGFMPSDYYEFFFGRFDVLTQLVRTDITPYGSAEITLTLTKGSGNVLLGMFAIGDAAPSGVPQRDVSVEPTDFSYFKQDAYGNATIIKRVNSTGLSLTTKMEISEANTVLGNLKKVLGTPVVVIGSSVEGYEWLTGFGLVSGSMSAADYPYVTLKITLKGLI